MKCEPKWNSWAILFVNSLIALTGMLIVHFLWYGLKDVSAYSRPWSEIGVAWIFALAYAYLFNKVTYHWRLDYAFGIVNRKHGVSNQCGFSGTNFFNALILGFIVMVMVFTAMTLAGLVMSSFFVFMLDGIRGAVPPPDAGSAAAAAGQIGGATVLLEVMGKTEGQPRRPL